jgi:hypothetical protein
MNAALQKAIDALQIHDVCLRTAVASIDDGFEPKYDPEPERLVLQFLHEVTKSAVLELNNDGDTQQLYRVYIELGARWVERPLEGEGAKSEPDVKAIVRVVMVAEYLMREHPGEAALKEFAIHNASYHVWPYWREYLSSQCLRMNLPKVTLPAVQFAVRGAADKAANLGG